MTKRILVVGAGAVGSYISGWLSHEGHEVTVLDPWSEHVAAVNERGLSVSGPHEPFTASLDMLNLHEAQRLARRPAFDIGFICVKSFDTSWAATLAARFIGNDGYLVSAQNCWNDPTVAAIVGADRAVGLVMSSIQVALWEPGVVARGGKERRRDSGYDVFRAGEHDGRVSRRLRELVDMLEVIDGARVTDNLWGERWAKLCQNCMGNPVTAISGMGTSVLASDPRGRELQIRLASESSQRRLVPRLPCAAVRRISMPKHGRTRRTGASTKRSTIRLPAGRVEMTGSLRWRRTHTKAAQPKSTK